MHNIWVCGALRRESRLREGPGKEPMEREGAGGPPITSTATAGRIYSV